MSLGYLRFQIGCVFAKYDLFKPTISIQNYIYIYEFSYKDTVLYQFLETDTSDITFKGRDQELK